MSTADWWADIPGEACCSGEAECYVVKRGGNWHLIERL